VNRVVKCLALMLCGVAAWETLPAHAQYGGYGASQVKVPLYGAYYSGGDPPAGAPADDRLARIEKTLEAVAAQVAYVAAYVKRAEELEKQAEPARGQAGGLDPAVSSTLTACAKCHHATVADKQGAGYVMFDANGRYTATSARDLRKQGKRVKSDDPAFIMPPPRFGALTAEQRQKFHATVTAEADAQEKK
jgi:cytochrome c553